MPLCIKRQFISSDDGPPRPFVYNLPEDVLLEIFSYLRPYDVEKNPHQPSSHYYADLVAASHVCQYFRHNMLSCSSLWSTIVDTGSSESDNIDQVLAFIERSRSAPLHIHVTHPKVFERLESEVYRIRSFFLYIDYFDLTDGSCDEEWLSAYHNLVRHTSPQLEIAHIINKVLGSESDFEIGPFEEKQQPLPFFKGDFPKLRAFKLERHSMHLNGIDLSSIQHLAIEHFTEVSATQWLSIVSGTPNLTSLVLLNFCDIEDMPVSPTEEPSLPEINVSLPHLRSLDITGPISLCSDFISRVHTAQNLALKLQCYKASLRRRAFFEPIGHFIRNQAKDASVHYDTVHCHFSNNNMEFMWENNDYERPPLLLQFETDDSSIHGPSVDINSTTRIFDDVNAANTRIRNLHFRVHGFGSITYYENARGLIYSCLSKLAEVTTVHGELEILVHLFQYRPNAKAPIPLPTLQTIVITFEEEEKKRLGTNVLQPVYSFICWRKKIKRPVGHIILKKSEDFVHFSDEAIQLFREKFRNSTVVVEYTH